jgi:hypothetical protein
MENSRTTYETPILSGPVPYPVVEVVWNDASTDVGWDKVKKPKEELVLTLGFLVWNDDDHIVVASSICNDEYNTNCRIQIPIGMIKHIKQL